MSLTIMTQKEIQHLHWRAGFGISPEHLRRLSNQTKAQLVSELFRESERISPLKVNTSEIDHYTAQMFKEDKSRVQKFRNISNAKLKDLNAQWIRRLMTTSESLRERMTLFWANHFVCHDQNIYHVQQFNNTLRSHALGNFGDFVKAISKEAAMLKYLNNKQNRKLKPNENFARELMELFTLGEGHYSEMDVKESARAFTGYNHNFEGDFVLRKLQHDYDFKTFLGHTGRYNGDDIIDIILEQKQCARFICRKIYAYFVNDVVDEDRVEELTLLFFQDYNIEKLMRYIFMSDWFYAKEHIGSKIKSPIEFLVGITKAVPVQFKEQKDLFKIQKLLGQILLRPPNVAGWSGGKSWIDSNTIMLRLKLPSILLANAHISITEKGAFEDAFETYYSKKKRQFVDVNVDWKAFDHSFQEKPLKTLKDYLLMTELSNGTETYLETLSKASQRKYCVQLMSLPEYQMC